MPYCIEDDLTQYVLAEYLEAVNDINPDVIQQKIDGVSGEIDDALRGRYELPLGSVPETIHRIAGVLAAYESLGAITSLITDATVSGNEFLFLQEKAKQARKDLELIRSGKMDIGLKQLGAKPVDPGKIQVSAPDKVFSDSVMEKF